MKQAGHIFETEALPFDVTLANGMTVSCRQRVRVLPGRRVVCSGNITSNNAEPVFIKLYTAKDRSRIHWHRELAGLELLQQHGIRTPEVIYSGLTDSDKVYAIVTDEVTDSRDFLELWKAIQDDEARENLLSLLINTVASLHNVNLVQNDIHLRNFLVSDSTVYTLDGSDISHSKQLDKDEALANLGLLAAQFAPADDEELESVFSQYAAERNSSFDENDFPRFIRFRDQMREHRKKRYLKKIFRESTAFSADTNFFRRQLINKEYDSAELRSVLANPDSVIESSNTFLKQGNSSTVTRVAVGNRKMVIKRYNIKSLWHALSRAWRPSRAAVSWRNAHMLTVYGVPTAAPVAMVEHRFGPFFGKAYFVCEYLQGDTAREYFAAAPAADSTVVLQQIGEILEIFRRFHIAHGDMKATNFLIRGSRVWVIDLDGMQQIVDDKAFRRAHRKDIMRLLQNWEPGSAQEQMFKEIIGPL